MGRASLSYMAVREDEGLRRKSFQDSFWQVIKAQKKGAKKLELFFFMLHCYICFLCFTSNAGEADRPLTPSEDVRPVKLSHRLAQSRSTLGQVPTVPVQSSTLCSNSVASACLSFQKGHYLSG